MSSKWNRHKTELRFGNHKNNQLQNDWNEQDKANFVLEVLSELKQDDEKSVNYPKALRLLHQMITDEMNIPEELLY